jgi:sulfatase modifying factor 1
MQFFFDNKFKHLPKEEKTNARILGLAMVVSLFLLSNFGCSTTPQTVIPAPETFTNGFGMKFMKIPAGTFMLGSGMSVSETADRYGGKTGFYIDEHPQHQVTLTRSFYMQTTEVTVGQWRRFVQAVDYRTGAEVSGGSWTYTGGGILEFKNGYYWDNPGFKQSEENPVVCVSWNDVQAFVKWLNGKEDKTYSLPTEAQWEYAARAGTTTTFCFGNNADMLEEYAWYGKNSEKYTHPVGQKKPNSWGLHDMYGNVSEWCRDWYGKYPSGAVTDPKGPASGSEKVVRGGSFLGKARFSNSTFRYMFVPSYRIIVPGFRLAIKL